MSYIDKYYKEEDQYIECHIDNPLDAYVMIEVLRRECVNIIAYYRHLGLSKAEIRCIYSFSSNQYSSANLDSKFQDLGTRLGKSKFTSLQSSLSNLLIAGGEMTFKIKRGDRYCYKIENGKKIYLEVNNGDIRHVIIPSSLL